MNELEALVNFEKDNKWLQEHYTEIQDRYEGKFVAVENGNIIASDRNLEDLLRKLRENGKDPAMLLVEFVRRKGEILVL